MRRSIKFAFLGLALILAAGIIAPFIGVDQYKEQIRDGLERSLHRKVRIYGDAHLNLFRGPGFSVGKVVIEDEPGAGVEPLADVPELQTTVGLSSLWRGRIEFASVRLVEPRLNLVKPDNGPWNVLGLLAGASQARDVRLPEIQISDGRIDFKFGDLKSAFYLTDTDLTVTPGRNGCDVRFSGAPARTDRVAQGYGLFSGSGSWTGEKLDVDLQLEKSPLEELVTLVRGQSLGLHGMIASRAKISGPLMRPLITGRFELDDVHRWDLIPGRAGNWSMAYRGSLDIGAQSFELIAGKAENPNVPIALRLLVQNVLSQPDWLVEASIDGLKASGLMEFARHMGAPLPATISTEGKVAGTVRYGPASGVNGELTVENASVKLDRTAEFALPTAMLVIEGDEARLLPAELSAAGNRALLELRYAPFRQVLEAKLTGRGLRLADLQNGAGHLLNGMAVPLASRFHGGTWNGVVHYLATGDEPGEWRADLQLRDTSTTVPGIDAPLKISSADVAIAGERIEVHRMSASAGDVEIFGEYKYEPEAQRPHRFTITVPSADAGELERLLSPSLHRTSGFLARTLRWRSPLPDWLRERRADGELRIGTLSAGDLRFRAFRSRVAWMGGIVRLQEAEARVDEGSLSGMLTVDVTRAEPQYSFEGTLRNLPWKTGHVDVDGIVSSGGTGLGVLTNLKAEGTFQARGVAVAPDLALRTASGAFDMTVAQSGPQIRVSGLQAASGAERFSGEASTQPDGRVQVEMASQLRSIKVDLSGERQSAR